MHFRDAAYLQSSAFKGCEIRAKNKEKAKKLRFFINFPLKVLVVRKKVVPLHPQNRNALGYGVMVTLQILVLPFLVRVRVPQLKRRLPNGSLFSAQSEKHLPSYPKWAEMPINTGLRAREVCSQHLPYTSRRSLLTSEFRY